MKEKQTTDSWVKGIKSVAVVHEGGWNDETMTGVKCEPNWWVRYENGECVSIIDQYLESLALILSHFPLSWSLMGSSISVTINVYYLLGYILQSGVAHHLL